MGTAPRFPSGIGKKQPVAALYSALAGWTSGSANTGIVVAFSEAFSAQDANNGVLTCLKPGRYKIVAGMRCRYCYFYVYVNDEQKILINGSRTGAGETELKQETEIVLKAGDVIKATSAWMNASERFSICYANIFKA